MSAMVSSPIKIYYWPMLARGASLVRMCEHAGAPYEYVSARDAMAPLCSVWNGEGDTFAPPVVVDGDVIISQSVATCLYLGKRLGLEPPGYDVFKAMQYCSDIVDTFEGNLGKNNEAGPALKAFLEGERWPKLMGNLERGVQGPYFFGAQPSPVDFFLLQHLDWREQQVFGPLKARHGVDALAPYPKLCGVAAALRAAPAYANYAGGLGFMGPIKDAILDSYHS